MELIKQYLALCWLNISPLELSKSTRFFKQNLIFNFAIFFFIQFNMTDDIESITEVIFEILLALAFISFTLWLNDSPQAYIQTSTAALFCENTTALALLPVMFWATVADDWPSYGMMSILLLWGWAMIAAIFKHVLNVNPLAGMIMSLLYLVCGFGGGFALNSLLSG